MTFEEVIDRLKTLTNEDPTLDVDICMVCFPQLGPPTPFLTGEPPLFWQHPFYKQRVLPLTRSVDATLMFSSLLVPNFRFTKLDLDLKQGVYVSEMTNINAPEIDPVDWVRGPQTRMPQTALLSAAIEVHRQMGN